MAGRFVNPFPQYLDATPTVRSGAKLFFYAAGTSTKLDTYSDRGLSVANTNPIVLNSAGFPSVDIYLQDLDYKVVLAPATDSDPPSAPIWTADYVRSRDSALVAKTLTGSGSPNGSVAGTAGSASILPDFYWDFTNSILYVCTVTGTSSTAAWTALNASSATAAVPPPQGRLTLNGSAPVLSSDAISGTAVAYLPYVGNLVPIYNGASMIPTEFSPPNLSLSASHAANTIYDIFIFSNSGVLTLVTGPAWTNSTAGSCARGTGASTTELTRVKGVWVNAVSMTGRNGSTTYSIGANLATYLGSILIDGSAGQCTCHVSWGQSRKFNLWNAYNRQPIILKGGDSTSTWNVPNNALAFRQSNGAAGNTLAVFTGLAEEAYVVKFTQRVTISANQTVQIAIGQNSTTAAIGQTAVLPGSNTTNLNLPINQTVEYISPPTLGLNNYNSLEGANAAAAVFGTEASMVLSAQLRG